jgi:thiol-disulfide isomerase/thioredoxin
MKKNLLIMKKVYLTLALCLVAISSFAQHEQRIHNFLCKYFDWNEQFYDQPAPDFRLVTPGGEVFTNESLRGKVVVLDFWATWCPPCKELTGQLYERLREYSPSEVVMIGVNYQERDPEEALNYWKKMGYNVPMVQDEQLGAALKAGHPTVVLLDTAGIIRAHLSAWTPTRAAEFELLAWVLLKNPEISVAAAVREARFAKEYMHAVYLFEMAQPAEPDRVAEYYRDHFEALINVNAWDARNFGNDLMKASNDSEQVLSDLGAIVAGAQDIHPDLFLWGASIFEKLASKHGYQDDFVVQDLMGRCYFRGKQMEKASSCAETALNLAKSQQASSVTLQYLSGVLDSYQDASTE